jgi:hypothetical protein
LGFRYTTGDYEQATGARGVRLLGGFSEQLRFLHTVFPSITRKRVIDGTAIGASARIGVVAVERLGSALPLFDITTGTGDFFVPPREDPRGQRRRGNAPTQDTSLHGS